MTNKNNINKIKNIEDLKSIQIVCRNQEQVKNCLNYLKQLGFDVDYYNCENCLIVLYGTSFDGFLTSYELEEKYVEFYNKEFVKTLQKFIKEKEEKKEKIKDIEVASDGRITKINNYKSKEKVFIAYDWNYKNQVSMLNEVEDFTPEFLDYSLKYGFAFSTQEARDRAMFKLEIETKLKNIAEKLNNGQKINWEDKNQNKYEIFYNFNNGDLYGWSNTNTKEIGQIYCLDKNFLEVAKQEIGVENLIKYFEE